MSKVDTGAVRTAGRTSALHFVPHFVLGGLCFGVSWTQWGAADGVLTALAPWLLLAGGALVVRALSVILFGTRWWITKDQVVHLIASPVVGVILVTIPDLGRYRQPARIRKADARACRLVTATQQAGGRRVESRTGGKKCQLPGVQCRLYRQGRDFRV